jgi:tRNA nucleotidyltransferase (CCA-adding enzyme)
MNQAGTDLMPLLFTLQQADLLSQSEYKQKEKLMRLEAAKRCYREICEAGEAVCVKDLAIGGRELIQMGMTPGPAIGEMLQQLLEHVLAHPEDNEKEKLLFLAKEWKK